MIDASCGVSPSAVIMAIDSVETPHVTKAPRYEDTSPMMNMKKILSSSVMD